MESGYSQEESEEAIARVLSVIDSTEHFLSQTTAVLEEVSVPKSCVQLLDVNRAGSLEMC